MIAIAFFFALQMSLTPYMIKLVVDGVVQVGEDGERLLEVIWLPVTVYLALGFSMTLVFRVHDWLIFNTFPKMKSAIIGEMFDYIKGHSYGYFQENFAGSFGNKINEMATVITRAIPKFIQEFFARILILVIAGMIALTVHPSFALVLSVWMVLFIGGSYFLCRKAKGFSEEFSQSRSTVTGKIIDTVTNVFNMKLFASEGYESQHLRSHLDDHVEKDRNLQRYFFSVRTAQSLGMMVLLTIMTWLLIHERINGRVTVGDFALILTLTGIITREIFSIVQDLIKLFEDIGICSHALTVISTAHQIQDRPNASLLQVSHGEIIFDRVSFSYKKEQPLFVDQSVTIHPGERVGLVGLSGSGKSTFVNLILRFFDIDSGQIRIDGQSIADVTQESLRSQIAVIPQETIMFHRTLMENIRYGRLEATDEEVIACAKRAGCHAFITNIEEGYEALVGERGVKLSGGQRQRIAIARAMLKQAPILILDEVTSSLDSITERQVRNALAELMEGKTSIVIAHRFSTLCSVDRLLVFDHGKIVEQGTHEDLLKRQGQYAQLWNAQADDTLRLSPAP